MVLIGCGGVSITTFKRLSMIKTAKIKMVVGSGVCQDDKCLLFLVVKYTCFYRIYMVDILKYTPPHPIPTRSVGLTPVQINNQITKY